LIRFGTEAEGVALAKPALARHPCAMPGACAKVLPYPSAIAETPSRAMLWLLRSALPDLEVEHLLLAGFDRLARVIFVAPLGHGSQRSVAVDGRRLFALLATPGLAAIMLAHNHPSGDPQPSHGDIALTGRIAGIAAFADIGLIDHIILTRDGHVSFRTLSLL